MLTERTSFVKLTLLSVIEQTSQQTKISTNQKKSSRTDEDALVSEMLGGASRQQPTMTSSWDEDLSAPKVG